MTYFLAVVSGVGSTHKVLIRPAIQVWVFSTNEAISSVTGLTLTLVHWVTEVADVDTFSIFVTIVGLVLAWVLWLTHLKKKKGSWKCIVKFDYIQHQRNYALPEKEKKIWLSMPLSSVFSCFLSAPEDMFKSRVFISPLLLIAFFLEGHSNLRATLKWSEGLMERFLTKPKCRAFLGTLDFMKSNIIHRISHYDPLLPLYCSVRYSQLPLITRGWRITPVWMPLHELIEQKVTARTGLWSKLWNEAP